MEELFNKVLKVTVRWRDCEHRKANIRVTIELRTTTDHAHKRDLLLKLTDDLDPFFLFTLPISDEDFQSLKVQQGLLVDFVSFRQKLIDLLNLCYSQQTSEYPRFLLQLSCQSAALDGPCHLSVVETNAFKHLDHLSLRFIQGSDKDVKDYLAACFSTLKAEKLALELRLQKTEDLSRQLTEHQQATCQELSEVKFKNESVIKELKVKLVGAEEESQHAKQQVASLQRDNCTLNTEFHDKELVVSQLKLRVAVLEQGISDKEGAVSQLKLRVAVLEQGISDKERVMSQLQLRVAMLEQGISDKEHLVGRTTEVLKATQQQKALLEENAESKDRHLQKLEATVKLMSEDQQKVNGIVRKLQEELQELRGKNKMKNGVIVSQEKVLQETTVELQRVQKDCRSTQETLASKEGQLVKLKEQLESTAQKLSECKEVLKTNENVIRWLNKQLNEKQLLRKPLESLENPALISPTPGLRVYFRPQTGGLSLPVGPLADVCPTKLQAGQTAKSHKGLDSKCFERRPCSIPIYTPSTNPPSRDFCQRPKAAIDSAYFSA